MDLLLGVDLGTTACKVTVVASDLAVSSVSSPPYPISAPHREWAEQDPRAWGAAVDTTIQRALDSVGAGLHDHVTLSITGQMHSLVLLDSDGNPARPAILWADRRATAECTMIENKVPNVAAITGNPPLPAFTLPQLLWVRRHEPDVLSRTSHVLLPKDYLRWRYTGRVVTDWTDASGTGMLDSATREWSTTILSALEIDLAALAAGGGSSRRRRCRRAKRQPGAAGSSNSRRRGRSVCRSHICGPNPCRRYGDHPWHVSGRLGRI